MLCYVTENSVSKEKTRESRRRGKQVEIVNIWYGLTQKKLTHYTYGKLLTTFSEIMLNKQKCVR
jgi:hypothetical protein